MDADRAKQQMIDVVRDATDRLGGEWVAEIGPGYPAECSLSNGDEGASWQYVVRRKSLGDPASDSEQLADHWRTQGMTIDRRGTDERPTIVGRGGQVSSVGLSVSAKAYSVTAVSLCFPGNADEISEERSDDGS